MSTRRIEGFVKFIVLVYSFESVLSDVSIDNTTITLEEAIRRQDEIDKLDPANALSRQRRYLIFPEGSSFQLVHCLTYGMYIGLEDIFYMGVTAALAWELPTDPYSPFRHRADPLHRMDVGDVMYEDDYYYKEEPVSGQNILVNRYTGKSIQSKKYFSKKHDVYTKKGLKKVIQYPHKKLKLNAVFAKRSADRQEKQKTKRATVMKIDREAMHQAEKNRMYLKTEHMNWKNIEFHRQSRSKLYEKIEKFLRGLGYDGRHCVLKALCEMGQDSGKTQGSFLDEILRAIFTLPSGIDFKTMHHQAYDSAHLSRNNCTQLYPKCKTSIKDLK